jgi:hypothetical protein
MCVPFIKRCGVPPVRVKRNARAECTPHVVVVLSAPIDQHPYEPIPGAGGDTVGAASARQQEREIASQVLRAVEHCFRRLKAGLKVRAMASLSQYCVYALRLAACLYVYSFPSPLQATFLCRRCQAQGAFVTSMALQLAANHAARLVPNAPTQTVDGTLPVRGQPLDPLELEILRVVDTFT